MIQIQYLGRRHGPDGGVGVDPGDHLIAFNDGAVFLEDLGEHAVVQRRDLQRDLVGLDVDQVFAAFHALAGLFLPFQQGGLGDGFGQNGYFYINQHDFLLGWWRADSAARAGASAK